MRVEVGPDHVAVVTLGDSPSGSVLDDAFLAELERVLRELGTADGIAGAVVSGARGGFTLARDLRTLPSWRLSREAEHAATDFARVLGKLGALGKPVVAAIHGPALGAGLELALACHAIVATDDATTRLGFSEVHLGLLPAGNGLLRVAKRAGASVALDLGLRGEPVDARAAKRLGLVDDVCREATLLEVARERARRPTRRARLEVARRPFRDNPVARLRVVARARAAVRAGPPGGSAAAGRMIDVVERYARSGFAAAAALEAKVFGELVVSEASRRLVEVAVETAALGPDGEQGRMPRALVERSVPAYADRVHTRYLDEARVLATEGVPARRINAALVEWGWAAGPLPEDGMSAAKSPAPAIEDIQMRCVLPFVNEALACLGEHVVRDPRDGDLGAVLALGFPAFRGGPFRYVDAVGPAEVLRRVRAYEAELGERWAPAPVLLERARTGERFYP
jgi:enoyl-CoA hydratase/carnithine racemase